MQTIELLAPAKNLECGMAAIDHGADAVYIGAERFGARVAAGNSVDDIAALCRHAHVFGAKVYVTVNTIIYDDELDDTRRLTEQLHEVGVDAILVQDMVLVEGFKGDKGFKGGNGLALHASTQTDNRTVEKVRWLRSLGFRRVVLARELTLEEIRMIHEAVPDVELEVFVHGALCVSYSGLCYASQYCFGRSANRGACAQFCRLAFDLADADGRVIERGRHLLSLKDMCRIDQLEPLMEAGVVSFKIEGRLKDVSYVKNVVAAYSQRLNEIVDRHPDRYQRASKGRCIYTFKPNLKKTFNRGFTHYFLYGRQPDIASFDTPKALGEFVGQVKEIRGNSFTVAGTASFANGDGLCFFRKEKAERLGERGNMVLEGFRVNKVVNNRLFPLTMPKGLHPGMALYRNNDQEFERLLAKPSSERKIEVELLFEAVQDGFRLQMTDTDGHLLASVAADFEHQTAKQPQGNNIRNQLSKLGGTPFVCRQVETESQTDSLFVPSSLLANMRRMAVEAAVKQIMEKHGLQVALNSEGKDEAKENKKEEGTNLFLPALYEQFPYMLNVANSMAREFYRRHGLDNVEPAFELQQSLSANADSPLLLMQCRHCLRYSLGYCNKSNDKDYGQRNSRPQWREPLYLVLPDGKRFRLQFDCKRCQMNVYAER
ncbi:MAG: U32 family peptidase [Prevotella sp.]|nr:U32 family peptidase [Prevotella sp.]